jgi:hypothetical protein
MEVIMAEYRFSAFRVLALGALCAVGASFAAAARSLSVFFVAAFPSPEPPHALTPPTTAPRVLGRFQARAYADRLMARLSNHDARAPLAGAFVTA